MEIVPLQYVFKKGRKRLYITLFKENNNINIVVPFEAGEPQSTTGQKIGVKNLIPCVVQAGDRFHLTSGGGPIEVIALFHKEGKNWATIRNLKVDKRTVIELNLLMKTVEKFI